MSARSFWTILLKLLGVFVILQVITTIPTSLNFIISMTVMSGQGAPSNGLVFIALYLIVLICIFWLLIYATLIKPEWTIDILKLEEGILEEKLNISMHRSAILIIVIMIIGGVTLVESLPVLCRDIFVALQQSREFAGIKNTPPAGNIILNFIRSAFSIFMLTSPRLIVNYIEKKRRNSVAKVLD